MPSILTLKKLFNLPSDAENRVKGKTFVGIDFGTSTTVVSVASLNNGKIKCESLQLQQKDADGASIESELLPTVIAINDSNKLIVGQGAYSLKSNPDYIFGENIWYSFKMELGKDLGPRWFSSKHGKIKSPQEATKMFFSYLKKCIEMACSDNGLSTDIQYAVSIPASFESNQRKDLLEALEANGMHLTGNTLIDEPNAAFLGYINHDYEQKKIVFGSESKPKVLVFDFGAGTCDISIIEIGLSKDGVKTKNISISQFTELGGNDIDRYIAWNYILPVFLKNNDKTEDDYTLKQINVIVAQLMGIAERLKKEASRAFHFYMEDDEMNKMNRNGNVKVNVPTCVVTDKGDLTQEIFVLSYHEFIETMNAFFNRSISNAVKKGRQKQYNSIYASIESALKKAHVDKDDINYVMMVGGSSKNPFVQKCIKDYFPNDVLIGQDIQSLVSQGAAIHSILRHAFGFSAVNPITSEPIVIIVEGENAIPVIAAGTEIPFDPVIVKSLSTHEMPSMRIEIPICVTNAKKQLSNLIIERNDGQLLPENTPIELQFEMSADKVLSVSAKCSDITCSVESENPFANTYLTNNEKEILKAEKEFYIDAERNGGKPSRSAFDRLLALYRKTDQDFLAAELLEEKSHYYTTVDYNLIAVYYHNSGNYNKAIRFLEKAVSIDPFNPYVHSNLGHDYYIIGKNAEAEKHLLKSIELRGDNAIPMIKLGELYESEEKDEQASEYFNRANNIMMREWKSGQMNNVELGWFRSLAYRMHNFALATEISKSIEKGKTVDVGYDKENLAHFTIKEDDV